MFGKDHHTDDSFNIRTMLTFCMLAFICGCNTPGAPESIMTPAVKMPKWLYRVESEHLNKSMTDEEKMNPAYWAMYKDANCIIGSSAFDFLLQNLEKIRLN